jgi:hypothetical protein
VGGRRDKRTARRHGSLSWLVASVRRVFSRIKKGRARNSPTSAGPAADRVEWALGQGRHVAATGVTVSARQVHETSLRDGVAPTGLSGGEPAQQSADVEVGHTNSTTAPAIEAETEDSLWLQPSVETDAASEIRHDDDEPLAEGEAQPIPINEHRPSSWGAVEGAGVELREGEGLGSAFVDLPEPIPDSAAAGTHADVGRSTGAALEMTRNNAPPDDAEVDCHSGPTVVAEEANSADGISLAESAVSADLSGPTGDPAPNEISFAVSSDSKTLASDGFPAVSSEADAYVGPIEPEKQDDSNREIGPDIFPADSTNRLGLIESNVIDVAQDEVSSNASPAPQHDMDGVSKATDDANRSDTMQTPLIPEVQLKLTSALEPASGKTNEDVVAPADALLERQTEQRVPRPYNPRLNRKDAAVGEPKPTKRERGEGSQSKSSQIAELLFAFRSGGWGGDLSIVLPQNAEPVEEVSLNFEGAVRRVGALDDSFFEPLAVSEPSTILSSGIYIQSSSGTPRSWVRTGRRLHVFAQRVGFAGFVSVPRVSIGLEAVLLCLDDIRDDVLRFLTLAGATSPVRVSGPGLPPGWTCLRSVWVQQPWEAESCDELFQALNPFPDARIEFSGGISLDANTWISGHPPTITIVGTKPAVGELKIDDRVARQTDDENWIGEGWSGIGHHVVSFSGITRRYSIVDIENTWTSWPAHNLTVGTVCGALVSGTGGNQVSAMDRAGAQWLIGASPGQVELARQSPAGVAFSSQSFEPIWAVSASTRTPVWTLVGRLTPPSRTAKASAYSVAVWCQLLRASANKSATASAEAIKLWQMYSDAARAIRRERRT